MPQCPQCTKPLREFTRRCPSCQADLDLLVDYVSNLQGGLGRAEQLTRDGELGRAFWAYLEVLEVDPDNPAARKQISQVVTAVRQFDRVTPGRRWSSGLGPESVWNSPWIWLGAALVVVLLVTAFTLGFALGGYAVPSEGDPARTEPPEIKKNESLSGK